MNLDQFLLVIVYNIFAKVLSSRLKKLLSRVISPQQFGFLEVGKYVKLLALFIKGFIRSN
jgi:hypothetical protein